MTHDYRVRSRTPHFTGPMFRIVTDEVEMPGGEVAKRDYMVHIGAVGVVAIDDEDRVVLVRQYRHPVAQYLWELPAGLIDVAGEPLDRAAVRELEEEADLTAGHLELLVDMHPSPGCSNEVIRLFLARDLSPVPDGHRHRHRVVRGRPGRSGLPGRRGSRFRQLDRQPVGVGVFDGRPDEPGEQRVGPGRPALELRMGLGGHEVRVPVPVQLDELHQAPVR